MSRGDRKRSSLNRARAKAAAVARAVSWDRLASSAGWRGVTKPAVSRGPVETDATEGDSPVGESRPVSWTTPEYPGTRGILGESALTTA